MEADLHSSHQFRGWEGSGAPRSTLRCANVAVIRRD
jgi:hypothetical protein